MRRPTRYIVSDEHRFVYFVVQKVACSSIKTALLPLFDFEESGPRLVREDQTTAVHPLFTESRYQLQNREFLNGLENGRYDSYFKFSFVRNPWDRLVSCYLQKLDPEGQHVRKRYLGLTLREGASFRQFAEAVCEVSDEEANSHFRSQHVALYNEDGELLPDFTGRFENLQEDFALVGAKIGAPRLELPHLTPSLSRKGRYYRDFYDAELEERVGERFRKDIELFGYCF